MRSLPWILTALALLAACDDGADREEPPAGEPIGGSEGQSPEPTGPAPEPEGAPRGRTSPDGMCGGIAGFTCPEGQWCDLEGDYPDASGRCRPEGECDQVTDCEAQDLVHPMCVGGWRCDEGRCGWECA